MLKISDQSSCHLAPTSMMLWMSGAHLWRPNAQNSSTGHTNGVQTVQNQLRRENFTPQQVVSYLNPNLFIFYYFYLAQFHPNKTAVMFYHRGWVKWGRIQKSKLFHAPKHTQPDHRDCSNVLCTERNQFHPRIVNVWTLGWCRMGYQMDAEWAEMEGIAMEGGEIGQASHLKILA